MLLKDEQKEQKEKFSWWFCRHALMGVIEQARNFYDENEKCYMLFDFHKALLPGCRKKQ